MRNLLSALFLILIVAACNSAQDGPYKMVKMKTQKTEAGDSSTFNEMYLYVAGDNPDIDSLKSFCTKRKKDFTSKGIHVMAFFDKEEKADFPKSIANGYTQWENIKAIYTYNTATGLSRLDYFEDNAPAPTASFDIP